MKTKIPDPEYTRREAEASARLEAIGELENARAWIEQNRNDFENEGEFMTPMEWAELEMPAGVFGSVLRFIGLF